MVLGRLDNYLYQYYKRDMEKGIITDDEVLELISCALLKIGEVRCLVRVDGTVNIAICGVMPHPQ